MAYTGLSDALRTLEGVYSSGLPVFPALVRDAQAAFGGQVAAALAASDAATADCAKTVAAAEVLENDVNVAKADVSS
jgi:hypothetical protein